MNDLYYSDNYYLMYGDTNLEPEDGWGGEITADINNRYVPCSISLFSNYYFNKIAWIYNDSTWATTAENIGSVFYAGGTIRAKTYPCSFLTLSVEYDYLFSRILEDGKSFSEEKEMAYTPEHTLFITADISVKKVSFVTTLNIVGSRYTDDGNTTKLDPYALVNVAAEMHSCSWVTPYIKIGNLLNQSYEQTHYYPMPGLSATLGAKFKIEWK
jgi:outer membrane cobalamin receptor